MHPREFYRLGELLASSGAHPEASQRTAISRSYYAAMLEARDLLISAKGLRFPRNKTHQIVLDSYRAADPEDLRVIWRLLLELKKLRDNADYSVADAPGNASEALRLSNDIHSALGTADISKCQVPPGSK